jgi:hypothetical protein
MLLRFKELFFAFALGEAFLAFGVGLVENEGMEAGGFGEAAEGELPEGAAAGGRAELMVSLLLPGTKTMMATVNPIIVAPIMTKGA